MVAALVLTLLAIATVVLFALCATGRVHRNPIAGIRIPALFASDEAWRVGHRAALIPMVVTTVICAVLTIVAAAVPSFAAGGTWAAVIVLLGGLLAAAMVAGRAARALTRG
ncbi:SdpI family protein [Microbacterium luticocti]|uniref:SdpI family protein n=1 Tax=Microbacterium luticocti TaxID=451764 RepID=UPI00048EC994|nr:SdpI family protein [Microbacterium luticocti]